MSSMVRPTLSMSALLALATPARAADDPPPRVALTWLAPPECPSEATVRSKLERLTGHAAIVPTIPVGIRVTQVGHGLWRARISVEHPGNVAPREREIEGETCNDLTEAVSVIVALAIATPVDSASLSPPENTGLERVRERPPKPTSTESSMETGFTALAGIDFASLPAPAPGATVTVFVAFGKNRIEVTGGAWATERASVMTASGSTVGGDIGLIAAGARYCRSVIAGSIEVAPCGGIEAGAMHGLGFSGDNSLTTGALPWIAPQVSALGLYHLWHNVAVAVSVDALVPVMRWSFRIDRMGEVFRPPPVTGRAFIGFQVPFR